MEVSGERKDGVLWLCVSGRINILNAEQFEEAVADVMEDGDRAVIMDLENVTYISSAGLYAVLRTAKSLQQRDTPFALCALSDNVRTVFERVGFDSIIAIQPSRADALASLDG